MSTNGEHTHDGRDGRDEAIVVQLPEHPPTLTPPAARALLRLLRKASQDSGEERIGRDGDDEEWRDAA